MAFIKCHKCGELRSEHSLMCLSCGTGPEGGEAQRDKIIAHLKTQDSNTLHPEVKGALRHLKHASEFLSFYHHVHDELTKRDWKEWVSELEWNAVFEERVEPGTSDNQYLMLYHEIQIGFDSGFTTFWYHPKATIGGDDSNRHISFPDSYEDSPILSVANALGYNYDELGAEYASDRFSIDKAESQVLIEQDDMSSDGEAGVIRIEGNSTMYVRQFFDGPDFLSEYLLMTHAVLETLYQADEEDRSAASPLKRVMKSVL